MLKRTVLYETHKDLNAKLVDFGGWEMPVQYTSIIAEHTAVRENAGIFDASHMGEIRVTGEQAKEKLNRLITNDLNALRDGKAMYTFMCYEDGGVIDDLLVYKINEEDYFCVVNAGNIEKDFNWIHSNIDGAGTTVKNESEDNALIAVQGPNAARILQNFTETDLRSVSVFSFVFGQVCGAEAMISRTGYTGEDGFELYVRPASAAVIWEALMNAGAVPAGLGARDTLRLEAALPLYGHELSSEITPIEAGQSRFVKIEKADFIGKVALVSKAAARIIIGVELTERGVPREGCRIEYNGADIGYVTSGTHSPTLKAGIAMALVQITEGLSAGAEVAVVIRGKQVKGKVVKLPFYRRKKANR